MKLKPPISLAWIRFTSCSGCQLMLLNCEASLAELSKVVAIRDFPMASSAAGNDQQVDIGLVEGSISSPAELERLLAFRRKVHQLVAVGACALSGGVNSLVREDRCQAMSRIYATQAEQWNSFPPQAVEHFVKVDGQIPGCPPEASELLNCIAALLHGGWPGYQVMPVCMECRINENPCLLERDKAPCLGPITLAGCDARCPGRGVACEGCRGLVAEANRDELCRLFSAAGLTEHEIRHRLERFGGTL